ncbi:MAG TPA: Asp23/Gls24 family envelope stress response protein [Candidatus Omnitrophica bacterium]|nr:Asp23/Gls24 family envelope stress response protein [Candidatus Omnitrophota bacterium]
MIANKNEQGEMKIHNEVIIAIARRATLEVEGVEKIASGFRKGLLSFVGRRKFFRGVVVEKEGEQEVKIIISIIVKFGISIPEVVKAVQENVKRKLEEMTGIIPVKVDVEVEGISQEGIIEVLESLKEKSREE